MAGLAGPLCCACNFPASLTSAPPNLIESSWSNFNPKTENEFNRRLRRLHGYNRLRLSVTWSFATKIFVRTSPITPSKSVKFIPPGNDNQIVFGSFQHHRQLSLGLRDGIRRSHGRTISLEALRQEPFPPGSAIVGRAASIQEPRPLCILRDHRGLRAMILSDFPILLRSDHTVQDRFMPDG
jgi:hypothetical protein